MEVDPSKAAATVAYQGATFYFCSQSCAAKFRTAPEKYAQLDPNASPSPTHAKSALP
jgi:Cu+-exporting ATPase